MPGAFPPAARQPIPVNEYLPATIVTMRRLREHGSAMEPRVRQIADYLLGRTSAAEVDPAALGGRLLPHVFVLAIERMRAELRLRILLAGTALDTAFGQPLKARCIEDFMHGPHGASVIQGFHDCAKHGTPLWMRQVVSIGGRMPRFVEGVVVHLPEDRIYGGLVVGEIAEAPPGGSFERRALRCPHAAPPLTCRSQSCML